MKPRPVTRRGFTLVELLVVIAIILTLAAFSLMGVRMARTKAEGARAISNLREIGLMLATHASDNHNRLPPARADIELDSGWEQMHWFEALVEGTHSSLEPDHWRNREWWLENKPALLNPKIDETSKPNAHDWWNPGYALNRQIVANLDPDGIGNDWNAGKRGPQTFAIPLAAIRNTSRTPIVAPRADWHFTYTDSELEEPGLQQFLIDGKMPILFVDGHVETMTLAEYGERNLAEEPRR